MCVTVVGKPYAFQNPCEKATTNYDKDFME
jgi:hypothetical protein